MLDPAAGAAGAMLQALGAAEAGEKVPWKMCCSWQPSKGCCGRMSEGGQSYKLPAHWDFCTDHTLQSRLEAAYTASTKSSCRQHKLPGSCWYFYVTSAPSPSGSSVPLPYKCSRSHFKCWSDTRGFSRSRAHASGLRIRKLHRLGWAADVRFPVQSASWRRWKYCA